MEAFINHLNRSLVELEEYSGLRKKLDSRRLALDAAISKAEKTYKKVPSWGFQWGRFDAQVSEGTESNRARRRDQDGPSPLQSTLITIL